MTRDGRIDLISQAAQAQAVLQDYHRDDGQIHGETRAIPRLHLQLHSHVRETAIRAGIAVLLQNHAADNTSDDSQTGREEIDKPHARTGQIDPIVG